MTASVLNALKTYKTDFVLYAFISARENKESSQKSEHPTNFEAKHREFNYFVAYYRKTKRNYKYP